MSNNLDLVWFEDIGYFPVDTYWAENNLSEDSVYNKDYFEKYVGYQNKDCSITNARVKFVEDLFQRESIKEGKVLDIGIGSGSFVSASERYKGFDVNPAGIEWLHNQNKWADPYEKSIPSAKETFDAFTFWDSLEHIKSISEILRRCPQYIVVSIPLFMDEDDCRNSKHFRKDEHFWYFTYLSFLKFMSRFGYELLEYSDMECALGRESIGTFAFKKLSKE